MELSRIGGMDNYAGGVAQLKELTKRTTFIRVAEQENKVYTRK